MRLSQVTLKKISGISNTNNCHEQIEFQYVLIDICVINIESAKNAVRCKCIRWAEVYSCRVNSSSSAPRLHCSLMVLALEVGKHMKSRCVEQCRRVFVLHCAYPENLQPHICNTTRNSFRWALKWQRRRTSFVLCSVALFNFYQYQPLTFSYF